MPKALVSDLSRTILFAKDPGYQDKLNSLHNSLFAKNSGYDFWAYFEFDEALVDCYKTLGQHIPVYLFTKENIQDFAPLKARLDQVFTGIFAADALGWPKNDPDTYVKMAEQIGVATSEVLFVDDLEANLQPARQAGYQVLQRITSEQVVKEIEELFS